MQCNSVKYTDTTDRAAICTRKLSKIGRIYKQLFAEALEIHSLRLHGFLAQDAQWQTMVIREPGLGTHHPVNIKSISHLLLKPGNTANLFSQTDLAKIPAYCTKLQIRVNPVLTFIGHLESVKKNVISISEKNLMPSEVLVILTRAVQTRNRKTVVPGLAGPRFYFQKHSQLGDVIHAQSYNEFATFPQKNHPTS